MSRALELLGVVSPAAKTIAQPEKTDPALLKSIVPGAAVGVLGATVWKNHRVLGFLAGDALGLNAYRVYRNQGDDRKRALCNLVSAGAGIAGSLAWKKHPFWGWALGFMAGSVVTSFVPGSNAHNFKRSMG